MRELAPTRSVTQLARTNRSVAAEERRKTGGVGEGINNGKPLHSARRLDSSFVGQRGRHIKQERNAGKGTSVSTVRCGMLAPSCTSDNLASCVVILCTNRLRQKRGLGFHSRGHVETSNFYNAVLAQRIEPPHWTTRTRED